MKAKQFLFVAVVVAILVGALAIPVAAEDEIPMWVHSIRMTLKGRATSPSANLVGTVAVRDASNEPVAGATVGVEFSSTSGMHWLTYGDTSAQGTVSFNISSPESGEYTLCVLSVGKEGWEYDPDLSKENCDSLIVP